MGYSIGLGWIIVVMLTGILPYLSGGVIPLIIWCMPLYIFMKFELSASIKFLVLVLSCFLSLIVSGLIYETNLNITLGL